MNTREILAVLYDVKEAMEDETGDDYDIGPHTTMSDLIKVIRDLEARGDVKWFEILERWAIRVAVVFWGTVACAIVGRYFWELSHGAIPFQWLVGAR